MRSRRTRAIGRGYSASKEGALSDDEMFVLLASGVIAMIAWPLWFVRALRVSAFVTSGAARAPVLLAPWVCAGLLFAVLRTSAASDVRDAPQYLFMYQVLGAAWVAMGALWLRRLGISVIDDAVERRNVAASWTIAGYLAGMTLVYAGSNIGDGPGWWVVVFTGGLATSAYVALWLARERFESLSESVVVERDVAAGFRLCGWSVAIGLVLGRAAAGNWTGPLTAVTDFLRLGWPALLLTVLAVAIEPRLRASVRSPRPSWFAAGLVPAAVFVGAASAWVVVTRPWS